MNKRRCFLLILIVLICLMSSPVVYFASASSDGLYYEYGDRFQPPIIDSYGNELTNGPAITKYTLVFYLSPTCGSCIDAIRNITRIMRIIGNNTLDYLVIFEHNKPESLLEKYHVPSNIVATLMEQKLSMTTPAYFIIDPEGKVFFKSNNLASAIEKLFNMDIFNVDELKHNTNEYLRSILPDSAKKNLVYFSMRGCGDCDEANKIIDFDPDILDSYEVTKIYDIYDENDQGALVDDFELYLRVYEIDWYPCFMILDGDDMYFISRVPITQLKSILMHK